LRSIICNEASRLGQLPNVVDVNKTPKARSPTYWSSQEEEKTVWGGSLLHCSTNPVIVEEEL
jgi:hypothetical protein